VGAEIARIEGGDIEAMRLYEEAIRIGAPAWVVQNEALAMRWPRVLPGARLRDDRHAYLRNARTATTAGARSAN